MPCRGTACMRCLGTAREVPAAVGLKRRDDRLKRRGRVKCISLDRVVSVDAGFVLVQKLASGKVGKFTAAGPWKS